MEPTVSTTSDNHAAAGNSPASTAADGKDLAVGLEGVSEPPSQPGAIQSGPAQKSITPCHVDAKLLEHAPEGLTQEELAEEDKEIYGASTTDSVNVADILRILQKPGLIDRQDGVESSNESSEEESEASSTAPTTTS